MKHDKRVILVTGANQGIGYQIAKDLAAAGITVLLGSRDIAKGEAAAKTIQGDVRAIQLDVTDQKSISAAADRIKRELGRLDVLVNNAAISNTLKKDGDTLADYMKRSVASLVSIDEVRAIWETNVFGVLATTQAMVPLLRATPGSSMVLVGSGAGSLTINADPKSEWRNIYTPGYAASKTGSHAMALAFASELEPEGIKVSVVSPGFTKTALNNNEGTDTLEQGAAEAVRMALLGGDAPSIRLTHATMGTMPW